MITKIGMILFFGAWALQYFAHVPSLDLIVAIGALLAVIGLIAGV